MQSLHYANYQYITWYKSYLSSLILIISTIIFGEEILLYLCISAIISILYNKRYDN